VPLFHHPRALRRLLSLFLALAAWVTELPAAERVGGAGWTMNVPDGYRHVYEDDGQTLVLTPSDPDAYLLRFTYHSLKAYVKERPKVGREFIAHLAAKKGLATFPVDGNGGVAYLEPPVVTEQDGGHVQERVGGLGLDDAYVTFTVVIDEAALSEPAVQDLLRAGLNALLGRIRSTET
jgi:hypothetical protein